MLRRLRLPALGLLSCLAFSAAAFDAVPKRSIDLSGTWKLNAGLSDDAQHMLAERQREQREEYMRWRRQQERMYPREAPPPIDVDGPVRRNEPSPSRRATIKRQQENLYKMLAISDTLTIRRASTNATAASDDAIQIWTSRTLGRLFSDGVAPGAITPGASQINDLIVNTYYVSADSDVRSGLPPCETFSCEAFWMKPGGTPSAWQLAAMTGSAPGRSQPLHGSATNS